jgi:hypothetical protein
MSIVTHSLGLIITSLSGGSTTPSTDSSKPAEAIDVKPQTNNASITLFMFSSFESSP